MKIAIYFSIQVNEIMERGGGCHYQVINLELEHH